jgi:hypothetical protein
LRSIGRGKDVFGIAPVRPPPYLETVVSLEKGIDEVARCRDFREAYSFFAISRKICSVRYFSNRIKIIGK